MTGEQFALATLMMWEQLTKEVHVVAVTLACIVILMALRMLFNVVKGHPL